MTNISQKIVFFGTEEFSTYSLKKLIEAGYTIAAVVTKPDNRKGRGQKLTEPPVKTIALQHNIPVLQPQKIMDISDELKSIDHPLGVLVSYGKIIPQAIIDLFTPGIVNVHPSLLPTYRGPSPIESAIEHGDQETGVTIMQLSAEMDAGPIYAYIPHELTGRETRPELYTTLGQLGAELLLAVLPDIAHGRMMPGLQDDSISSYSSLLNKSDAYLQPQTQTASEAERLIRAHLGFPKSKLSVQGHEIIITKAHVTDQQETPLDVAFKGGTYLSVDELIAPSGKLMNAAAFLRGYHLTQ